MRRIASLLAAVVTAAACTATPGASSDGPPHRSGTLPVPSTIGGVSPQEASRPGDEVATVTVDLGDEIGPISPLILGMSGFVGGPGYLQDVGVTLTSWGGNPSSRYNFELGNAWNTGSDWNYSNVDYDGVPNAASAFIQESLSGGSEVRLAVPTLGWVAKNNDGNTCSFPLPGGGCGDAARANCEQPGEVADPRRANQPSTSGMVRDWVARLLGTPGHRLRFVAFDNEPELWGFTHYDVHPQCPTYEEILDRYLEYAREVREVAPDVDLAGPVACCWFPWWRNEPGPTSGPHESYLPWFLDRVRQHDADVGRRHLDVLDVHYYPQSDVFNDSVDSETSARRLRSTRSLYDPSYVDESWIAHPIRFIPYLRDLIAAHYPGTRLLISEWNFGADGSMNGALAIADVLAIYGREGVDAAAYWRNPSPRSPGYYAFKIHGNYDGRGGRFGGVALGTTSSDVDLLRAYAARDGDRLRVLLLNLDPARERAVQVDLEGWNGSDEGLLYQYSQERPDGIASQPLDGLGADTLELPPYSITLLELDPSLPGSSSRSDLAEPR